MGSTRTPPMACSGQYSSALTDSFTGSTYMGTSTRAAILRAVLAAVLLLLRPSTVLAQKEQPLTVPEAAEALLRLKDLDARVKTAYRETIPVHQQRSALTARQNLFIARKDVEGSHRLDAEI